MTWFSSGSVDVTEHFATNAFASCIAVAHYSFGGGDDGYSKAAEDFWKATGVLVDAQARLADPLHGANGGETVLAAVLEGEIVSNLTSVIVGILGLGIVGSLAFGDMLGLDVIGNITSLVESLATNGVVGLLVLAVLMSLVKS